MSGSQVLPIFVATISLIVSAVALIVSLLRNRWMAKQMRLASAISIINWLEEVRPQRLLLYNTRHENKHFEQWSVEEKEAANKVSRRLDILGMLENLDYLDPRLVDRFYAFPAKEIWDICKDWIVNERSRRGPQHLWEFERLADRIKYVKSNHPAIAKTSDWPKDPRVPSSA